MAYKFGDKIGECQCCDKDNTPLQYSSYFCGDICEYCWESIADNVISGQ